jgi:CheY-like chemotaxis protein
MATTFLLIDDDGDDRQLFCEALRDIDPLIECLAESNGRLALAKLERREFVKPDIIFLDINMPIINGWEILKKLKEDENHKDIPVVMYSTSNLDFDIEKAQRYGALSFLTKPYDFKQLKNSLQVILEHVKRGSLTEISHIFSFI